MSSEAPRVRSSAAIAAGLFALFFLVAWFAYRDLLALGFLGWDTYPIVLTARVQSLGDLVAPLFEELMSGRYTDGHLYRPLLSLSLGLDALVWGLDPYGFHLSDLLILVANGLLLALFGRRLLALSWWAAGLAGLLFVLHPIQLEILPVPPRRCDSLCLTFFLATLLVQRKPGEPPLGGRVWLGALASGGFFFAALLVKETAAALLPLILLLHATWNDGSLRQRALAALRRTAPILVAALPYAALRMTVIGGLGGHGDGSSTLANLANMPRLVLPMLKRVALPQPIVGVDAAPPWIAAVLAGLLAVQLAWALRARAAAARSPHLFLAIWLALILAITSLAGRLVDWYAMFFCVPYVWIVGWLAQEALRALRANGGKHALELVLPVAASALLILASPFFAHYDDWDRADAAASDFVARFDDAVANTPDGGRVLLERLPFYFAAPETGRGLRSLWILHDYSMQAYAELVHPERNVEVHWYYPGQAPPRPPADGVQILVTPGSRKAP